jgi:hypothetical protein
MVNSSEKNKDDIKVTLVSLIQYSVTTYCIVDTLNRITTNPSDIGSYIFSLPEVIAAYFLVKESMKKVCTQKEPFENSYKELLENIKKHKKEINYSSRST